MSPNLFLALILTPLALLATAYILWPLLRRAPVVDAGSGDARRLNREIVRERREQLDRELALLPADSPERDRLILEFSAAALSDLEGEQGATTRIRPPRWITAAILTGLLLAGPLVFYRLAGLPEMAAPDFTRAGLAQDPAALIAELERRLQAEPDLADGWLLLGRSKMALGDLPGATAALEKALAVDSPVDELAAQIRVDLADAIAQGSAARLAGRPWQLIREALARDGRNQKALALAGAYQVTQGDPAAALSYWETLHGLLPPDSEQRRQIAAFVADVRSGRMPGAPAREPGREPGREPARGPAQETAPGPVLRGRVELSEVLASRANPDDTVFVAVRGVDPDGRPVGPPAAAARLTVADLPATFELSDRHAMSPASKLSDQQRVVVVARVSRAGTAASATGDLEGRSSIVAPDAEGVQVRIDRVLP